MPGSPLSFHFGRPFKYVLAILLCPLFKVQWNLVEQIRVVLNVSEQFFLRIVIGVVAYQEVYLLLYLIDLGKQ